MVLGDLQRLYLVFRGVNQSRRKPPNISEQGMKSNANDAFKLGYY
jgi:hypothetical protein